MPEVEDWLQDPLRKIEGGSYKSRKLRSPANEEQNDLWRSSHFSTRLKLDAAEHFCRRVLGAASMPDDIGLPLLAHRELKWYLDVFFFELMSAYDVLLQELNFVYCYNVGLKAEDVRWERIKKELPEELVRYLEDERGKDWFKKVRWYRNMAAHHSHLWTGSGTVTTGDKPWDYDEYGLSIYYLDDTNELKVEKISVCTNYLKKMVNHIHQVWEKMAPEFE